MNDIRVSKFQLTLLLIIFFSWQQLVSFVPVAFAAGREVAIPDIQFQPIKPTRAITIREAVDLSLRNYPSIASKVFKLHAAKANVTLAKTQYLPNLNVDVQESAATPNRVNSVVMNNVSGFDTVPVFDGPSANHISGNPVISNLEGLNLNWLLVDQGLRHANDSFAFADERIARADVNLTKLDVAFAAANSFLDAVAAKQNIKSASAALEHMETASLQAKTLVSQGLRPGVETADWQYEVVKAKISVIKADRDTRLALVELAEKIGVAAEDVEVVSTPLINGPTVMANFGATDLTAHPVALLKHAEIDRWRAKQVVLDKAYRPHLWLNASVWGKGSNDKTNTLPIVGAGILPQAPNYMIGLTYSFPIMEYFPLKAQIKMAKSNEQAARADFDLAMQILEKKDARVRVLLAQARKIAEQTPSLVDAAKVREIQVTKRYSTGLTNMVSLAQAEKGLAEAQVENAQAQVDVWRAILQLAYIQGDLRPFLKIVEIAEGNMPDVNTRK